MLSQLATKSYQQNNVNTADPFKLLLIAYERAILGCRKRNIEMAGRAILELVNGLNMEAGNISYSLLAIYQYCGELIREGQYDESARILTELRDTWVEAGNKMKSDQ